VDVINDQTGGFALKSNVRQKTETETDIDFKKIEKKSTPTSIKKNDIDPALL